MGRMTESMPVLPAWVGWKQEVSMNAYSVRSPLEILGVHVSTGRGDQPSLPVMRRFIVVPPTP